MARVTFTKHAAEKFGVLSRFGFELSQEQVISTIAAPDRIDIKGVQRFATKVLDKELALRVVYEERKGIIVVITFYPVRRDRYGL